MRLPRTIRRLAGRTDVRVAATIGGILILIVAIQGFALYSFLSAESLEEGDRWVEHALETIHAPVARGLSASEAIDDMRGSLPDLAPPVRLWDGEDRLVREWGAWPASGRLVAARFGDDQRSLHDSRLLRPDNFLVGSTRLAAGERVQLALPLRHLANETAEVGRGLVLLALLLGAAALVVGVRATSSAFAPIRRATSLLRGVNARQLGSRLVTSGSGDPLDRHAQTLNGVLAEIDDSFARVRAFGGDLAHELRTPVNRIGNMAEVALLADEPREMTRTLETIRDSAAQISRIIDSLLLLSEIYGEGFELQRTAVDLDARILRTAEVYAPLFEERDIKLETRTQAGMVQGDGTLIDRVLVNLLDNALRHASAGGTVQIGGFRCDGGVVVHVDDSGQGIPRKDRDRVFDRFARLDPARTRQGSGLGLALARAIARLHGGDLEVGDSPLGGARFVLNLPEVSRLGVQREARHASPAASRASRLVGPQAATAGETRSP